MDPGQLLVGRFLIRETLGRGGMGVVYGALDQERGVEVAIKTLRGVTPEGVLRFKHEFRALSDVRHPNLVELGELFENAGAWFFTMELVRGVSFLDWVWEGPSAGTSGSADSWSRPNELSSKTEIDSSAETATVVETPRSITGRPARAAHARRAAPACDMERLRGVLAGLARGLAALHGNGKVHRDIKPSNLLVDASGRVVLLDFGVVAEHEQVHREKAMIGTLRYMAPEQTLAADVGPAADWYAVGGLVFQALTGSLPFAEFHGDDLVGAKRHFDAPRPSELADGIPADLDELAHRMLDPDPARRPSELEIFATLGIGRDDDRGDDLFVGRAGELATLGELLATSRQACAGVVIGGESGVGKSTLIRRFLGGARIEHRRLIALAGRCHERERVAFNAIDGLIDDLARFLVTRRPHSAERLVPAGVGALVSVFPALRASPAFVAAAATAGPLPSDVRGTAIAALRGLLAMIAARRPVVIVIDDLQWADADSMAVLEELIRPDGAPCLLVIATVRAGIENDELVHRLAATRAAVSRIALEGLAARDAQQLVRLVGGHHVDQSDVVGESRGHPLFLRELARRPAGSRARLSDLIHDRVAALPDDSRRLLETIAVARSPIPRLVAFAAAGLAREHADPQVAALAGSRLVRSHGPLPGDAVEPFHDRIAEAICAQLSVERQRTTHGAIARALEASGAPAATLYERFELAGDRERAARYLIVAAGDALASFAFGRAAELYRRTLDTVELDPQRRSAVLIGLGEALANDGRTGGAAECFLEAAGLEGSPDAESNDDRRLDLLRRAAERFLMAGRVEAGFATARAVLAHVDMPLPETRVRTIIGIAWNQLRMRGRALDWKARPASTPRSLRADVCWSIGAGLGMVDTLLGAYFSSHAGRIALASGSPFQIARGMGIAGLGAALLGRRDRAQQLLATAERAAEVDGTPLAAWYLRLARTSVVFTIDNAWQSTHDNARLLETEWYAGGRGPGWETDIAMHFSLASLQLLGELAQLSRRVAELVRGARTSGNLFQEVTLRVRFALRQLAADDVEQAMADVTEPLAAWMPGQGDDSFGNQRAWALWSRTRASLYANRFEDLDEEWARMRRSLMGRVPLMRVEWFWCYGTYLLGQAVAQPSQAQAIERRREAARYADRLGKLPFPAAPALEAALRAAIAWTGDNDDELVRTLTTAVELSPRVPILTPFLQRRLGEAIGGDQGRALIESGDAAARAAGWVSPERAAEVVLPSGRFG